MKKWCKDTEMFPLNDPIELKALLLFEILIEGGQARSELLVTI